MKSAFLSLVFCLALGLTASVAYAGPGCGGGGATAAVSNLFGEADANADGALSRAEYLDAGLDSFGVSFEDSDLDGNGSTSLDEYFELYEKHHPPVERLDV